MDNILLPKIQLTHLEALTDDTGIYQHATFNVPNRSEGYCVDDNARALILTVQLESASARTDRLMLLQNRYLSFVAHAFDGEARTFRNFMSFGREWLESRGSDDSQGRSIWALGVTAGSSHNLDHAAYSGKLFEQAIKVITPSGSPRACAYSMLGISSYLERYPSSVPATELLKEMTDYMSRILSSNSTTGWKWFELTVAYANARLPQALIRAGFVLGNKSAIENGLEALDWLMTTQVAPNKTFCPVGTQGADRDTFGTVQFDQQPIEACGSVSACLSAYDVTGEISYLKKAIWCFDWFLGKNVLGKFVADVETGGCYDGLISTGVNLNQGAESTLSYLSALVELHAHANKISAADVPEHSYAQ